MTFYDFVLEQMAPAGDARLRTVVHLLRWCRSPEYSKYSVDLGEGFVTVWCHDRFGPPRLLVGPSSIERLRTSLYWTVVSAIQEDVLMRKPKQVGKADSGLVATLAAGDTSLEPIVKFLVDEQYEDGSPRQTGTMSISFSDGSLKAMLRERQLGLCLWVSAPDLLTLLSAAANRLDDVEADWRPDKFGPGKGKK